MVLLDGDNILTNLGYISAKMAHRNIDSSKFGIYSVHIGDNICFNRFQINCFKGPAVAGMSRFFVRTRAFPEGTYIYNRVTDGIQWGPPVVGNDVYRLVGDYTDPTSMEIIVDLFTEVVEEIITMEESRDIVKLVEAPVGIVINSFPTFSY
jgi:hypothetical protein